MTDHESANAEVASKTPPAASEKENAPASVGETSHADGQATEEPMNPSPKTENGEAASPSPNDANGSRNGKDAKLVSGTPKGKNGKNNRDREKGKNKEKDKDSKVKDGGEGKPPKKSEPYVNEDRVRTGGAQREKLSPEELAARMEKIRLNNEKIKERRAAVQADERAFQESQAALRARDAEQKKIQSSINEKRAAYARRKMERAGGREWDSFKKGANAEGGQGTSASMHAPQATDVAEEASWNTDVGPYGGGPDDAQEGGWGWGITEDSTSKGGEGESERAGRGRGGSRGVGRGRGRGRGEGRGRGDGRGGSGGSKRDKPSYVESANQDNDTGGWATAADEWGKPNDADNAEPTMQETGIAITTDEDDPWGVANVDDPWGTAGANDPWGNPPETKS